MISDASDLPTSATMDRNRVALQRAIDDAIAAGGGKICFPAGHNFPINRSTVLSNGWGVSVPSSNITELSFSGEGATIRFGRATGQGKFVGIQVMGTGPVRFHGITFSQKGIATMAEQQHMVQLGDGRVRGARDVLFYNCRFANGVGGDGIRLLGSGSTDSSLVQDIVVDNCAFVGCDRSGISFQRGVRRVLVTGCSFSGTIDQDIDCEPTGAGLMGQIKIIGNTFLRDGNGSASVTLTGQGGTDVNDQIVFANNVVYGGQLKVRKVSNLLITGNTINTGAATGSTAAIEIGNYARNVTVSNNAVTRPATSSAGGVIEVLYEESRPENVHISGNTLVQDTPDKAAVKSDSAKTITINDNIIVCSVGGVPAITVANDGSTAYGYENNARVINNAIAFTGSAGSHGIQVIGNQIALATASVTGNDVVNCVTGVSIAVRGGGAAHLGFTAPPVVAHNTLRDCATPVSTGGGSHYTIGGNAPHVCDSLGSVAPEGIVVAKIGSTFRLTTTGVRYLKTSGTGSTGWILE